MTEAIFGFLGVLVGASVTIVIEQLRSRAAQRERRNEWKLNMLERLTQAIGQIETQVIAIMNWREAEFEAGNGFKLLPEADSRMASLAEGLREAWIVAGSYLGEGLQNSVKSFRDQSVAIVYFVPTAGTDKEQRAELGDLVDKRNANAEQMMDLLHAEVQTTIGL